MSIYIHIPFCKSICSYCDFCKFYYNEKWVDKYLIALEKEITSRYNNELIDTIYIGGGTPTSLNINQLKKLLQLTKRFNFKTIEFTVETNVDLDLTKIKLLKKYGVNRISIGVQTVNQKHLKFLNRNHTKEEVINLVNQLKKYDFNINIDLMYGMPNQTLAELESDLDFILSLDVNHISTYSLIIEPHTKIYIDNVTNIDEDLDYQMYRLINQKLNNYVHYEISNYAKEGYYSKHNLVYWNNLEYYGFGIGASGYVDDVRYDNTKSYQNYIEGNYVLESHRLSKKEQIENEFILGFRKLKGINIFKFKEKYKIDILNINVVKQMLNDGKLLIDDGYLKINPNDIYISNTILVNFIDLSF